MSRFPFVSGQFAGLVLVAAFLIAPSARATTYVVRPDGLGDFPTIAAAISGAALGDTISLADGTFTGANNKNLDFGGKPLVIRSQSGVADACIIDCQGAGRGFTFQSGENSASRLERFTIKNGLMDDGGAIYCRANSSPRISGCILRENKALNGSAILCAESSDPSILGCQLLDNRGNTPTSGVGTINGQLGSTPLIEDCTFSGNYTSCIYGLYSSPTVTRCLFWKNFKGIMTFAQDSSPIVTGCTIVDNTFGNVSLHRGSPQFSDCTFAYNYAGGTAVISASLSNSTFSNVIIAHNDGRAFSASSDDVTLTCCDFFGNTNGDWTGSIADQEGVNGNFSADPLFCDPGHATPLLTLAENSPCAPDNNPECGLIGAWPVGCGSGCTIELTPEQIVTYFPCGGLIPIDLRVNNVAELGSFDVCVGFDGQDLSFDHVVVDTEFLGSTGRMVQPTSTALCSPDCQTDGMRFGANTVGVQPGPSGTGRLATTFWQPAGVDADTEDLLCLDGWIFANTDIPPESISVSTAPSLDLLHRRFCYGDFNDNGDVSIADVMQVGIRWGSATGDGSGIYDQMFDVNLREPGNYCASIPDGSIDIVDVQSVAARWGQGCPGAGPMPRATDSPGGFVFATEQSTLLQIVPEVLTIAGETGDTGVFTLEVVDVPALGAFESTVTFDPSVIQIESVELASFLGSTGRSASSPAPRIDNENGILTLAAWTIGDDPGPEGSGELARVTVSIRSCPSTTSVEITDAVLTDTSGWPYAVDGVVGGTVITECNTTTSTPLPALPASFELLSGRPNPFARSTTIPFAIPTSAGRSVRVELLIVDASGRTVRRLVQGDDEPGHHEVVWDGRDDRGIDAPSGAYFCRLLAGGTEMRKQIVLIE